MSIVTNLYLPLRCDFLICKKNSREPCCYFNVGILGVLFLTFPSDSAPSIYVGVYVLITGSCTFLGRIRDTCGGRLTPEHIKQLPELAPT